MSYIYISNQYVLIEYALISSINTSRTIEIGIKSYDKL